MSKTSKPALLIMAAGLGSRYGGLKQIDPISEQGEIILDFSLYDAMMAGFEDVVFVIRKENEEDFRALIDNRAGKHLNVHYAFQELSDLPQGYSVPEGRTKPFGTGQAVLAARDIIGGPFAVINADDYYGASAFQSIYDFLENARDGEKYDYTMVGFDLARTITENGHVSRGVCQVEGGKLTDIVERTMIMRRPAADFDGKVEKSEGENPIGYSVDGGDSWNALSEDTVVSMNFWGFTRSMMDELGERFSAFLDKALSENPLKGEYLLPEVVHQLLDEGKAEVKVLRSKDQWYGVTYKEDRDSVVNAVRSMKDKGFYPEKLWK